mmetsp:Transcript_55125/g.178611  ORF Transcript_55125/g.178611 Transcript_55125/m.178611 type:complete len:842 (-) Transcript_55125:445-2970(-)
MESRDAKRVTIMDLGAAVVAGKVSMKDIADGIMGGGAAAADDDNIFDTAEPRGGDTSKNSRMSTNIRTSSHSGHSTKRRTSLQGDHMGAEIRMSMSMSTRMTSRISTFIGVDSSAANLESGGGGHTDERRTRRNTEHQMTVGEHIDALAETVVNTNLEQAWFLESCMASPTCQRICFPAEHATRTKRQAADGNGPDNAEGGGKGKTLGADGSDIIWFGLEDFTCSGFSMVAVEDMALEDPSIYNVLGMTISLHRKTSVQRYCLQFPKANMPQGVGSQEVKSLVRLLHRCDHVNILCCREVFEDQDRIYFMYEYYPCCTMRSLYQSQTWTQEQIVNLARECCAAVAYATSIGLQHVGLTSSHILIPASAAKGGDPIVAKVFGFGLMGIVQIDQHDHLAWAPESLDRYNASLKDGSNFVLRMDGALRQSCDAWSLGVLIFTLAAKNPPFRDDAAVLQKKWQFSIAFEMLDAEAKTFVENFLNSIAEKRSRPAKALNHEWIRKRWRSPAGDEDVFRKLEDFVYAPLPKRLFGRFLTRFLAAEHLRAIAASFYTLDTQGTGVISVRELVQIAKANGRPQAAASAIFEWLAAPGGGSITLLRFAEAFAEEVIDGRALRHAFESLDDDGSEVVSPEELYEVLQEMDGSLTLAEVVRHIADAEQQVATLAGASKGDGYASGKDDQAIDYGEFCQLFPVRVQRMAVMSNRIDTERTTAEDLSGRFGSYRKKIQDWIAKLRGVVETIRKLSDTTIERTEAGSEAAKALKKEFSRLQDALGNAPGPFDAFEFQNMVQRAKKDFQRRQFGDDSPGHAKNKGKHKKEEVQVNSDLLGFDSFLQDVETSLEHHQ